MRIYLLIVVVCGVGLTGCEKANPAAPSAPPGGTAVARSPSTAISRSGAPVEPCAESGNRRRPC